MQVAPKKGRAEMMRQVAHASAAKPTPPRRLLQQGKEGQLRKGLQAPLANEARSQLETWVRLLLAPLPAQVVARTNARKIKAHHLAVDHLAKPLVLLDRQAVAELRAPRHRQMWTAENGWLMASRMSLCLAPAWPLRLLTSAWAVDLGQDFRKSPSGVAANRFCHQRR